MATLLCSIGTGGALTAQLPKSTPSLYSSSSYSLGPRVHILSGSRSSSHMAQARRSGLSSRSRRLEKRTKKGGDTTTIEEQDEGEVGEEAGASSSSSSSSSSFVEIGIGGEGEMEYSKGPMPKLEGLEPDFWEGPQWNALGFFIQYLWAFGILFGLISGGIAVATYNEGATDFKKTPVYKESLQSQELLEEPDASNADVFEANPTETAPSLE